MSKEKEEIKIEKLSLKEESMVVAGTSNREGKPMSEVGCSTVNTCMCACPCAIVP